MPCMCRLGRVRHTLATRRQACVASTGWALWGTEGRLVTPTSQASASLSNLIHHARRCYILGSAVLWSQGRGMLPRPKNCVRAADLVGGYWMRTRLETHAPV